MNCSNAVNEVTDFSKSRYPGEPQLLKTLDPEDYVKILFIVLVMVGTLLGNISIIVVVAINKSMHTTINIYVVNLAVADLLVCAICMTSFLSETLHTNHVYVLGPVMCKAIHFFQMTILISSVLTLSAIACDRFTAILFPLHTRITKQKTKLVLTAIWLISIAVSFPLLFVRKHYTLIFHDFVQKTCGDAWPETWDAVQGKCVTMKWLPQFYYTFLSVTLFFLPIAIMTATYSLILRRLSLSVPGETIEGNLNLQERSRKRVIKMVFTVLLVFVFCWMPLQCMILYDKHRAVQGALPSWYLEVTRGTRFLAYTNSFLNPIIYGAFNKSFRDNLCLLLRCNRRRRRFGTPQIVQRFRLTLTTALSTSSKKTSDARKDSAPVGENKAVHIANNQPARQGCPEENDIAQEENKEEDDTPL